MGRPLKGGKSALGELGGAAGGLQAVLLAPLAPQSLDMTAFPALPVQVSPSFNSTDGSQYATNNVSHAGLCPNASLITGDNSLGLLYFTLA